MAYLKTDKGMRQDLKVEILQEKMVKLRIWWYGHVLLMDDKRI